MMWCGYWGEMLPPSDRQTEGGGRKRGRERRRVNSSPTPSLALSRVEPAHCLGKAVELAQEVWVGVSWL